MSGSGANRSARRRLSDWPGSRAVRGENYYGYAHYHKNVIAIFGARVSYREVAVKQAAL
jgi:hypothetical protein